MAIHGAVQAFVAEHDALALYVESLERIILATADDTDRAQEELRNIRLACDVASATGSQ